MSPTYSWEEVRTEMAFSPEEEQEIARLAAEMMTEVRAYRLAEARKALGLTQTEMAATMGVTQERVSAIERGQIEKSEVGTLSSYAKALGGQLEIVLNLGGTRIVVG